MQIYFSVGNNYALALYKEELLATNQPCSSFYTLYQKTLPLSVYQKQEDFE